ncbi:hypothetical protein OROMI_017521 [Orobanche minor]
MAQAPASTPSAAPTVAPLLAQPTTAPSASVTPPASSPAPTSPSPSPPPPPTPSVAPAGSVALLVLSAGLMPFAVLVVIEPQYSVQIYFLVCDSSHLIEGFQVFHSLRRGRSAAMKENYDVATKDWSYVANKGSIDLCLEERSDCCVIDSFGKSIVLDCLKIQNLLLGLKKCNTEGRYKIRAIRFIKGIVTAPILFAIEEFPELRPIIDRGFDIHGDVDLIGEEMNDVGRQRSSTSTGTISDSISRKFIEWPVAAISCLQHLQSNNAVPPVQVRTYRSVQEQRTYNGGNNLFT